MIGFYLQVWTVIPTRDIPNIFLALFFKLKKGTIVLLFLHSDKHYLGHISEFYKKDP